MIEYLTNKLGIFRDPYYVKKSLQRLNHDQSTLDAFADRYSFDVVLVTNCQNCNFITDDTRTWDQQLENLVYLRDHFVAMYNIRINLREREGQIAKYNIVNIEEPEIDAQLTLLKEDISLNECIFEFVGENRDFFREEIKDPPKIHKGLLRYIVDNAF